MGEKFELILARDCEACAKLLRFMEDYVDCLPNLDRIEKDDNHSILDDRSKLGIKVFPTFKRNGEIVASGYTAIASYLMLEFY